MWLYGNNYGSTLNALFFISIICDWNFVNTNVFVHFQIRDQENRIFCFAYIYTFHFFKIIFQIRGQENIIFL